MTRWLRVRLKSQKGIALVITLMITALLVMVITEITQAVHLHQSMTGLFADSQSAGLLAEGGVELTSALIDRSTDGGYTFIDEEEIIILPIDDSLVTASIRDEQGRLSVNAIIEADGDDHNIFYPFYERLLLVLGLDEELAATAADWMDKNDLPRSMGAENHDYYMRSSSPYKSKGAPFDHVGELALVKGYDREVMEKLRPFVTVYGSGLININNAPREVLLALTDSSEAAQFADAVIDYRNETPFKKKSDINTLPGYELSILSLITVESKIFRIFSEARVDEAHREVEAVVELGSTDRKLFWRER